MAMRGESALTSFFRRGIDRLAGKLAKESGERGAHEGYAAHRVLYPAGLIGHRLGDAYE